MSNPAAKPSRIASLAPAGCCAVAAIVLGQFFGNATRGYVDTSSMFWWWISQWIDPRAESGHGWLILGISAVLFWRNLRKPDVGNRKPETGKRKLEAGNSEIQNPISALAAMVAGLALHVIGFAAQQTRISIVAFLVFVWGVLRLAGGPRWGRAAIFPVGFMVFAIPVNVLDTLGFWLRMGVIEASAWLAHTAGIDVLRSGTQLLAPDGRYNYDVAAACSGVRSLTALAALSLLLGYLSFHSWWRRALVLLFCFPLVYLGNVARIAAIIFAAEIGGQAWGDRAHAIMGYGVFVIVLGGVLAAVTLMQRWWPEKEAGGEGWTADEKDAASDTLHRSTGRAWISAGTVVVLAGGAMIFLQHLANSPERGEAGVLLTADGQNPVELPAFLGTDWIGRRSPVTPVEREILPADTGFSRKVYVSLAEKKRDVLLSIVLSGRDRTSIHRPELCLVGQGWTIDASARNEFRFPGQTGAAASLPATILEIRREVPVQGKTVIIPQLAAYWFVDSETVVATHWERFFRDAWKRVTRARADRWAYVLMQTDASDGNAAALARMQTVLDATLPAFMGGTAKPLNR